MCVPRFKSYSVVVDNVNEPPAFDSHTFTLSSLLCFDITVTLFATKYAA